MLDEPILVAGLKQSIGVVKKWQLNNGTQEKEKAKNLSAALLVQDIPMMARLIILAICVAKGMKTVMCQRRVSKWQEKD